MVAGTEGFRAKLRGSRSNEVKARCNIPPFSENCGFHGSRSLLSQGAERAQGVV
jgi:hypothetical protein